MLDWFRKVGEEEGGVLVRYFFIFTPLRADENFFHFPPAKAPQGGGGSLNHLSRFGGGGRGTHPPLSPPFRHRKPPPSPFLAPTTAPRPVGTTGTPLTSLPKRIAIPQSRGPCGFTLGAAFRSVLSCCRNHPALFGAREISQDTC